MTIPSDSVPFPGATPRPVGFYWIRTYGQVQHETVYGDVVSRWTGTEWESPWPVLDLEPIPAMDELRALRTERDALKDEVQRLREKDREWQDLADSALSGLSRAVETLKDLRSDDGGLFEGYAGTALVACEWAAERGYRRLREMNGTAEKLTIALRPWELAAYMREKKLLVVRPVKPRRSEMVCSGDCSGPIMEKAWRDPGLGGGEYLKVPCGDGASQRVFCPFGSIGEVLGIKEAGRTGKSLDNKSFAQIADSCLDAGYNRPWCPLKYEADGREENAWALRDFGGDWGKLRPAVHMPAWAIRHRPTIADIRVMRVGEIGADDVIATHIDLTGCPTDTAKRNVFASQWMKDHGKDSWASSPWCWFMNVVGGEE